VGDTISMAARSLLRNDFGVALTLDELEGPPLPEGPLVVAWRCYLASWSAGRRRDALAAVAEFVDLLEGAGGAVSTAFAKWLCSLLFDRSGFWAGQWGGGVDASQRCLAAAGRAGVDRSRAERPRGTAVSALRAA